MQTALAALTNFRAPRFVAIIGEVHKVVRFKRVNGGPKLGLLNTYVGH